MIIEPRDAPYPELKKTHTMAHSGRPFTDVKPPPAAPVWAAIEGLARYHVLLAAIELGVFDAVRDAGVGERRRARRPARRFERRTWRRCSTASSPSACSTRSATGTASTTRPAATSSATARPAWRSSCRSHPVRSTTGRGWPTPCGAGVRRRRSRTIRTASTFRSWRARSPRCGARRPGSTASCDTRSPGRRRGCSTSGPAVRRGRSPCSRPARRAMPSSTIFDRVLDVARRTTAEHGVADRCEFRPATTSTSTSSRALRPRRARARVPGGRCRRRAPPDPPRRPTRCGPAGG